MNCGDKNKTDSGWPDRVPHGCGREMHAVQYNNPADVPSVALLCPVCDGAGFRE